MQTIKAKITRRNIGNAKIGAMWQNTIRAGRKVIATITEPNTFNPGKYRISVKVAPGYSLISDTATMPAAVLEFDRLTDGKYSFNA